MCGGYALLRCVILRVDARVLSIAVWVCVLWMNCESQSSSNWNRGWLLDIAGVSASQAGRLAEKASGKSNGERLALVKRFLGAQLSVRGSAAPAVLGRPRWEFSWWLPNTWTKGGLVEKNVKFSFVFTYVRFYVFKTLKTWIRWHRNPLIQSRPSEYKKLIKHMYKKILVYVIWKTKIKEVNQSTRI